VAFEFGILGPVRRALDDKATIAHAKSVEFVLALDLSADTGSSPPGTQ
jgi:hypothetical protein